MQDKTLLGVERKEEWLRLHAAAMEAANDGILIADARASDLPIIYASQSFQRLTGYTPKEIIGRNCRFLQGPNSDKQVVAKIRKALEQGVPFQGKILNYRKNGEPFWNLLRIAPVRETTGKITHFVGIQTDITEQVRTEEESRRQREELAHLNRVATMGEFAASLAHEINQPLAAILNNAHAAQRLLAKDPPDLDEVRHALADIIADDKRASEVIQRLRAFLKKRDLERLPLDINKLVCETMTFVKDNAARKNVSIRLDLTPNLPFVQGDPIQLQQVILNLALNSFEAMNNEKARSQVLTVRTWQEAPERVAVSLRDTGIGLDPMLAERIFDPFFTTKPQGLGVGLAISRSIIEAHHGRLWATPNPDQGTTLNFTLPVAGTD